MASIISVKQEANSVKIGAYLNIEKKVLQHSFSEGSRTSVRTKVRVPHWRQDQNDFVVNQGHNHVCIFFQDIL